jgi:hypothetical protein
LKPNRLRNTRLQATLTVLYPFQGKIEFTINERMAFRAHVREKHTDLTIFDLFCRSTILLRNSCRLISLLGNYVSSKINTLDQQEDVIETSLLAVSLPRFLVTNLHTLSEQKLAAGLHKEPVVLPISFNASTHPFTVEPDFQGAS